MCIAVLLILVLAVVVHKRRSDDMFKDHDDIRENIINYEDEGGGEGDMTGYDLNVLRFPDDGENMKKPYDLLAGRRKLLTTHHKKYKLLVLYFLHQLDI